MAAVAPCVTDVPPVGPFDPQKMVFVALQGASTIVMRVSSKSYVDSSIVLFTSRWLFPQNETVLLVSNKSIDQQINCVDSIDC